MSPFEITKSMVAELGDEPLRELLGRLLEAEARKRGIPLAGVSLGGGQTAPDGGVDAAIDWAGLPEPGGWLQRHAIRYQCKAQRMAAAALGAEMRPAGKARPLFRELAASRGAYVVFTTDDPSSSALDDRLAAMREAVADVPEREAIALDFLGADRIARWAGEHPGVSMWLLERSGRGTAGWRRFGSWSFGPASPYITGDDLRVSIANRMLTVGDAIEEMRRTLRQPGGVVRLTGMSGMGKTRLAEALFDDAVGADALPRERAVYGDAGLDLATGAALITERLVLSGVDAVVVVDNCRARTHEQLAQLVRAEGSRSSVLTIDFDVGEDRPSGLLVRLQENAEGTVEALLAQRHPRLTLAERHHVARFAGGNARIALKVAEAGGDEVDLSRLADTELLDRLFQVGPQPADPQLRMAAAAASVVWAFHVEAGASAPAEHGALAALAELSPASFHRAVATLLDWGVIQQRGTQRAIMPPPLANMLAATFIRRTPPDVLVETVSASGPRLVRSFAHRLGQLHAEPTAVRIVEWLVGSDGPLFEAAALDETGRAALIDAAPAAPKAVLEALRRSLDGPLGAALAHPSAAGRAEYAKLLVKLAHGPDLFEDAVQVLTALAASDGEAKTDGRVGDSLVGLFSPILSGTLAPMDVRLRALNRLLEDSNLAKRMLGIDALGRMLKADNFFSGRDPTFGARARVAEWRPTDFDGWFNAAAGRLAEISRRGGPEGMRARQIMAAATQPLVQAGFAKVILAGLREARPAGHWDEGWRAVAKTLRFARTPTAPAGEARRVASPDELADLDELERVLRPATLDAYIEAFVFGQQFLLYRPGRGPPRARKIGLLARAAGRAFARSGCDQVGVIARAAGAPGPNGVAEFMRGLAARSGDVDALWATARRALADMPAERRHPRILLGILRATAATDPRWTGRRLDEVATDPMLAPCLATLSSVLPLDARALGRLTAALAAHRLDTHDLSPLRNGDVTAPLAGGDLAEFLATVAQHSDGPGAAMGILHMRMFGDNSRRAAIAPELIDAGRALLADPRLYTDELERDDHAAAEVAHEVLRAPGSGAAARAIAVAMHASDGRVRHFLREFTGVTAALMKFHPEAVLDALAEEGADAFDEKLARLFGGWAQNDDDQPASASVNAERLLAWVASDPSVRAPRLAAAVPYVHSLPDGSLDWSPLARSLIAATPEPVRVLEAFERRFDLGSGVGPWSRRFERRRAMVAGFVGHPDEGTRSWAAAAGRRIEESIRAWDEFERTKDSLFE